MPRIRWMWLGLLAALLLAGSGQAQQSNPNGVIPLHTVSQPYLFLVRDPAVHRDLGLTPEQIGKLTKLNDRLDLPLWSMRNKTPQHVAKTMQSVTAETKQALSSVLSEVQQARVQQIELWVLGLKSLMLDAVAQQIDLTSQQREDIKEIIVASQQRMNKLQQQVQQGGDLEELNREYREVQTNRQTQLLAALTEDQQRKYRQLLGKRIDVSQLGRIKMKAPPLSVAATAASNWVNSKPLSLQQLKGKVVALHFYAFA